ncbi:hypothetical protein Goari_022402 [Gossypium aridum]|uniref:Uncharacterized protein n=1 Tax=Gossypium aridum TaxID=34290 RepID=A0A7J8YQR2_GOSAI|nr:hypothetical protein [Gossypium aridum]
MMGCFKKMLSSLGSNSQIALLFPGFCPCCGEAISAHEHITAILNRLPFEYESIVSIILAGQLSYTVQNVTTMLIDAEARQQVILAETLSSTNLVSQQPA